FYRDVTDCWMPEWGPASGGKPVYVVINGSTSPPTLVPPAGGTSFPLNGTPPPPNPFVASLTTSAYPRQCTNVGSGAEADFTPLGAWGVAPALRRHVRDRLRPHADRLRGNGGHPGRESQVHSAE